MFQAIVGNQVVYDNINITLRIASQVTDDTTNLRCVHSYKDYELYRIPIVQLFSTLIPNGPVRGRPDVAGL